jgi:hypothetical protein
MLAREVWASKLFQDLEELKKIKSFSSSKCPVSEGRIPWQYVTKHQQLFLHN